MARTYRQAYAHGILLADLAYDQGGSPDGNTQYRRLSTQLDQLGEESLKRAVEILRRHADSNRSDFVDTLLDLGDWYQVSLARRDAMSRYREALAEAQVPGYVGDRLFETPRAIVYRDEDIGIERHRPPPDPASFNLYWARFDFTVTADGDVDDMKVVAAEGPSIYRGQLTEIFKKVRYRPRFVDGEPVATEHVSWRQGLYVRKRRG